MAIRAMFSSPIGWAEDIYSDMKVDASRGECNSCSWPCSSFDIVRVRSHVVEVRFTESNSNLSYIVSADLLSVQRDEKSQHVRIVHFLHCLMHEVRSTSLYIMCLSCDNHHQLG